jgi:hypothetical protein
MNKKGVPLSPLTYLVQLDSLVDPISRAVICPRCGFEYSHIQEVFTRLGHDPHEGGVAYAGTIAKGVVAGERRDCLVIKFKGECGHFFEWQIQQNKGNNHVTPVFTGRDEENFGPDVDPDGLLPA